MVEAFAFVNILNYEECYLCGYSVNFWTSCRDQIGARHVSTQDCIKEIIQHGNPPTPQKRQKEQVISA